MNRFVLVLLFSGIWMPAYVGAQAAEDLLKQANQAYTEGTYAFAIERYEEILTMNLVSPALYYNLGNAYFKTNHIAAAILNYERALRLSPFDKNIQHNLEIARGMTTDRIEPVPRLFYHRWWQSVLYWQSADSWAVWALTTLFLCLTAGLLYFFGNKRGLKKIGFVVASVLLLFTVLFFTFAEQQYKQSYTQREGIVFLPRMTVKSGPADTNPDLFVIHEGTKVTINDELGEWIEISLENGNVGWIRLAAIREI